MVLEESRRMSEMVEKVSEQTNEHIPLVAELETSSGDKVAIKTRWTKIGREKDNDIILQDDGYVSRYHAWITFEQEHFWVRETK
jgi:hypothetical protein